MGDYLGTDLSHTAMLTKDTYSTKGMLDSVLVTNTSASETNITNTNGTENVSDYLHNMPTGYTTPHVILASVLVSIIMFVIVFGNLLVVIAIATDKNLKTTQNWFIASLAVADFLLGLVIMPFSLANELMGYWYFGYLWCDLWKAIDVLLCTASILSICLISLDRYWSITRAMEYSSQRTPTRASMMIAAVWILSAVICVPPLIGWKNPLPVSDYPLCLLSDEIGYVLYSTMGSFYIPCVIMVFVYFKIFLAARALARRNMHRKSNTTASGNCSAKNPTDMPHTKIKNLCEYPSNLTVVEEMPYNSAQNVNSTAAGKDATRDSRLHAKLTNERSKLILSDSDTGSVGIVKHESDVDGKTDGAATDNGSVVQLVSDKPRDVCDLHGNMVNSITVNCHITNSCENDDALTADNPSSSPEQTVMDANENSSTEVEKNYSPSHKHIINIRKLSNTFVKKRHHRTGSDKSSKGWRTGSLREHERHKRKIAKARERRATIVLGLIMAAFILCWFPFFTLYIITSFCHCVAEPIFAVVFWAGYCNSALNPIIYTVFNRDFRQAFHKIVCVRLFRRTLCL